MTLTIKDIITDMSTFNNEDLIFARRTEGKFLSHSEAVVVQLNEEEKELRTNDIAELKCPGFEYFLDAFIIKDMINDFENSNNQVAKNDLIDIIIHYAEFDA